MVSPPLEDVARDFRLALRSLGRSPSFAIVAVLVLGLSLGAVATVMGMAHTFFWQLLPVQEPERLVVVSATREPEAIGAPISYADFVELSQGLRTVELASHYSSAPLFVELPGGAAELNGAVVSGNFFSLLGVAPERGRFFLDEEAGMAGRAAVVVLSDSTWRARFGAADEALGQELTINGVEHRIVGVAPPGFRGIVDQPVALYLPTMQLGVGYRWCDDPLGEPDCTVLSVIGRLAEGASLEQARAEILSRVPERYRDAQPGENRGLSVSAARGALRSPAQARLLSMLGAVAGVLLVVGCANLAGLLVARGTARRRELAVRASLGATRPRLLRQLLAETVVLGLIGGAIGLICSRGLTAALATMFFRSDGEGHSLRFDFGPPPGLILAVLVLSAGIGLAFGLLPALGASRPSVAALRARGSESGPGSRLERLLLAGQVAASVVLVSMAALFVSSIATLGSGAGYQAERVAVLRTRPRLLELGPERAQGFQRAALDALRSLPGVEAASLTGTGAVLGGFDATVERPGQGGATAPVRYSEVGPDYFRTLGIPVLRGRPLEAGDDAAAPAVAVVSEQLAQRLWPSDGEEAVGSILRFGERAVTVVGVVGDLGLDSRSPGTVPRLYLSYFQDPELEDARLAVRLGGDPAGTLTALVAAVHRVDPRVPISEVMTLSQQLDGRFQPLRMGAAVATYAGLLAALLSAIGLYAALAATVSRRTREIGIRLALGGTPADVRLQVVRAGMLPVVIGGASGTLLSVAVARALGHLLVVGSDGADPVAIGSAAALLILCGLAGCWSPARQAASISPARALEADIGG